jgi:iron complex transport system substrate-binding protein
MPIRFESGLGTGDSGLGKITSARWRLALVLVGLLVWSGVLAESPRVISLAPHLTELTYAAGVGEALVGTVDWSDYPPEAAELPLIGDAFRYDLETILGLNPDYVLAWRGGSPTSAVERVGDLGIEILWIETRSLDDIAGALETLGERLGRPEAGRQAAVELRTRLSQLEAAGSGKSERPVFYQVSARPLYTLGGRHVINEVLAKCGMRNIFADLDVEAAVVDREAVLAAEPELIIASRENNNNDPLAPWRKTRLVEEGITELHRVEPTLLVRPTPRIVEGIEFVCSLGR